MIKLIDDLLNRITMYRLGLYYLIFLLVIAFLMSVVGALAYDPFARLFSVGFLLAGLAVTNRIFASTFRVPANVESIYISALILALIVSPAQNMHDLIFLAWIGILAMASKYILAINRNHLFNPIAIAVALTAVIMNQPATWWVGNLPMLPFVLVGGLLIVRKIKRFEMVTIFLVSALFTTLALPVLTGNDPFIALQQTVVESPLVFFAALILTEPLTTPPTVNLQL